MSGINPKEAQVLFKETLEKDKDKSTGLAAIETLYEILNRSKSTTVQGMTADLKAAVDEIVKTDYSSASIQSASELFLRFISLIQKENEVNPDFTKIRNEYLTRGKIFIKRISSSRDVIAEWALPLIRNHLNILTHSYSKVVLQAMVAAKNRGSTFHVFVTESQPDASGRKMCEALRSHGIQSTLILDSAVAYLMSRINLVVFGAEGVMETGGIINKIGTYGIALCAKAMGKCVYVMAESIKFVRGYPLNQSDIPDQYKYRFSTLINQKDKLNDEHPLADYTPPQYINLLITDLGVFTPAAVGDELIKLYT